MHKGLCFKTVPTFLRGWQLRSGECHPDDDRVPQCHDNDGQDRRMGRGELDGIEIRDKYVDLHENSNTQRSKQRARLQTTKIQIHHGSSELNVRRCPGWPRVGIWTHHFLSEGKSFGSSAIRPCKPMLSPVEVVVVLGTKSQLDMSEQWSDNWETMRRSIWNFRVSGRWTLQDPAFKDRYVLFCADHLREIGTGLWGLTFLPDEGGSEDDLDTDEWKVEKCFEMMTSFISSEMMKVSISSSSSPSPRKSRLRVKKNLAVLKGAMTRTNACWLSGGWHTNTKRPGEYWTTDWDISVK